MGSKHRLLRLPDDRFQCFHVPTFYCSLLILAPTACTAVSLLVSKHQIFSAYCTYTARVRSARVNIPRHGSARTCLTNIDQCLGDSNYLLCSRQVYLCERRTEIAPGFRAFRSSSSQRRKSGSRVGEPCLSYYQSPFYLQSRISVLRPAFPARLKKCAESSSVKANKRSFFCRTGTIRRKWTRGMAGKTQGAFQTEYARAYQFASHA